MGELKLINPPVDGDAADGQLIRWNATAQKWEPVTGAVVDEAGNVQLPVPGGGRMILSDDEIKDGLNYHGHWLVPSKEMLAESHLEASSRIRELENEAKRYKSHVSRLNEGLRDMRAKLRELVEAAEEKDRFIGLEEPGLPDSKERNDFYDVKFRAWDRYQAALKAAKEE